MSDSSFRSPYFASIDLGSNSFHMLIVRVNENKIEIVDREKEMVQIARGIQTDGTLDEEAIERATSCLTRFSERLKDIPASQIRAVGTKTLRSVKNATHLIDSAERALGAPIQIISGYEEARLVYNGLAHTVINESDKRLVIDIGGGSTEFVIGKSYEPILLESLPLGCVTFTERYIKQFRGVNKVSMQKAYLAACNELEEIRKQYLSKGWSLAYGTSGTMRAIAELVSVEDGGAVITRASLKQLVKYTIEHGELPQADIPKLRREVLPAGLAILNAIFDELNIEQIHVADATLKEGLVYDTLGRFSDHDVRVDTINKLTSQYDIDTEQAERVSHLALNLWKDIKGPKLAGVSRTKILNWSAKLHEIGLNISHSSYHRHGYYILRYSDLAGFGRYEQYILANLVRFHRRKISLNNLEDLNSQAIEAFTPLLICLRIAVLMLRGRDDISERPKLRRVDLNRYALKFKQTFLDDHPLTLAGLEKEIGYLNNIGIELSIES